jgi:hypothetical protein
LTVADLNNDLKLDLISLSSDRTKLVFHNGNGNGGFTQSGTFDVIPNTSYLAIHDFDADGKNDLILLNNSKNEGSIALGTGNGTFASPVTYQLATDK